MSNLVAYDSTSEEDNLDSTEDASITAKDLNSGPAAIQVQIASHPTINDAPILGPSIPADITQGFDDLEEDAVVELPSSERDVVRYLTQPSHPMTEMPPSPPGSPNPSATSRIKHFLDLKAKGVHFNEDLASKNAFRNPSLLQTLLDRAGLDNYSTHQTSLPPDVFDSTKFPGLGYKEALLKSQQSIRSCEEAERKLLSAAGKRTMEFTSGGVSEGSSATSSPGGLHKRHRKYN